MNLPKVYRDVSISRTLAIITIFYFLKFLPTSQVENGNSSNIFFKDFIYLFLDRGEGREKGRESNISVWLPLGSPLLGTWPTTQAHAPTGSCTRNHLGLRLALDPLSHTSWGNSFNIYLPINREIEYLFI